MTVWASIASRLGLAATLLACAACSAPSTDPTVIGDQQILCAGRLPRALADALVGQPVGTLRMLNGFTATSPAGECELVGDDGAVLSVSVEADTGGTLAALLRELVSVANFSGDQVSAVAGEGPRTTAYAAVNEKFYVRVIGNRGSSAEQRAAALAIAFETVQVTQKLG